MTDDHDSESYLLASLHLEKDHHYQSKNRGVPLLSIPWQEQPQQQPSGADIMEDKNDPCPVPTSANNQTNDDTTNNNNNNNNTDKKQKKKKKKKKRLIRLLVCSGNLGNQQPDAASLAAWIPADGETQAVLVGGGGGGGSYDSSSSKYPLRCYPNSNSNNNNNHVQRQQQQSLQFRSSVQSIPESPEENIVDGCHNNNKNNACHQVAKREMFPQQQQQQQQQQSQSSQQFRSSTRSIPESQQHENNNNNNDCKNDARQEVQQRFKDDDDDDDKDDANGDNETAVEQQQQQFDLIVIGMQEATFEPPKTVPASSSSSSVQQSTPGSLNTNAADSEAFSLRPPGFVSSTMATASDSTAPAASPSAAAAAAASPSPTIMIKLQIPIVQPLVTKGLKKTVDTIAQFTANRDFTKQLPTQSPQQQQQQRQESNNNNTATATTSTTLLSAYNVFQIPLTEWNGGTKVLHQLLRARLPSYRHVVSFQRGQMRLEVFSLCRNHGDNIHQTHVVDGDDNDNILADDSDNYFARHDDTTHNNDVDNNNLYDNDDDSYCPVHVLQTSAQNTGLAGLANKGGIVTQLYLPKHALRLSFVTCHLEAHEGLSKYQVRCNSLADILNGTTPKERYSNPASGFSGWHDASISSHYCFVLGDLNFRTDAGRFLGNNNVRERDELLLNDDMLHNQMIRKWVQERDWESLNAVDELHHALRAGDVLQGGFTTLFCNFPPTFKLARQAGFFGVSVPDDDGDDGEKPLSSSTDNDDLLYIKKRRPSYTDRILWKSNHELQAHVRPMIYEPIEAFASSDHKPVRAAFEITAPSPLFCVPPPSSSRRALPRRHSQWLRKSVIRRVLPPPTESPPSSQPTLNGRQAANTSTWNVSGGSSRYNSNWLGSSKWSMGNDSSAGGVDVNHRNIHGGGAANHNTMNDLSEGSAFNQKHTNEMSEGSAFARLTRARSRRKNLASKSRDHLDLFVSSLSCEIYHEKDASSNSNITKAPPNPYVVLVSSPEEALRLVPRASYWTQFKQDFRRLFVQPLNCASHEHFADSPTANGLETCMRTECGWPRTSRQFATFEPTWDSSGKQHSLTNHVAIRTRVQTHRPDGSCIDLTGAMLHLTVMDFKTNAEDVVIGTCTFNLANLLRICRRPQPPKQKSISHRSFRSSFQSSGRKARERGTEKHANPVNGAAATATANMRTAAATERAALHRHGPFQSIRDIFGADYSSRSGRGSVPESIQEDAAEGENPVPRCEIDSILIKNGRETGRIRFEIEAWWIDAATDRLRPSL
jgi:hypothetical protein